MYRLIGSLKTRALRVAWMLEELEQAYEHDPLPPRDPALRAINPSLKVPVLKDGEDYIIDSVAIIQYLADKHGKMTFKAGSIDRAHQDSFTQFAVDDVESPLWVAAKHTFALPEELRVPDVKRACEFDFHRAMAALSTRLGDKQFVMGGTFTVPDLLLGHLLGWGVSMRWKIVEQNVTDYMGRIRNRPAFLKVIKARESA